MSQKGERLPPQGSRTPRGRRDRVTVPGAVASSSNDGLPSALSPSAGGKGIIDGWDLFPIFESANKAVDRGDLSMVVSCILKCLELIPKYRPPSKGDIKRKWEWRDVPFYWLNLLSYLYEGMKDRKDLSLQEESARKALNAYLNRVWESPPAPDPAAYNALWGTFSCLVSPVLQSHREICGGSGAGHLSRRSPSPAMAEGEDFRSDAPEELLGVSDVSSVEDSEEDLEEEEDRTVGEGFSKFLPPSGSNSRRGSKESADSGEGGKLSRLSRDQRGVVDRELAVLSGPAAPIIDKAAEWAQRIEKVRSKTTAMRGPLSGKLKVAGRLMHGAVCALAERGATAERELTLLREKNELLRLELLKQKEEREKHALPGLSRGQRGISMRITSGRTRKPRARGKFKAGSVSFVRKGARCRPRTSTEKIDARFRSVSARFDIIPV